MITGASSGIGHTVAKGLAKNGATVIVAARRIAKLQDLVASIKAAGGSAIPVEMDVTDRNSVNSGLMVSGM